MDDAKFLLLQKLSDPSREKNTPDLIKLVTSIPVTFAELSFTL
jgi:hypothetical protein